MQPRIAWIESQCALELRYRLVDVQRLTIGRAKHDVDFRGFTVLLEECREDLLCVVELPLAQITESQGDLGVAVAGRKPERFLQFEDGRIEAIHAEIKLAQQLPRLGIQRFLREQR